MSVQANALTGPATSVSGFTNIVNYTATATLHTTPALFASDASTSVGAGAATTVGAFSDTIDITLSNASAPAGLLVAGTYNGSVVVTLSAAI
jgi:hypothetical protein